jgi:hypothetical protein
MGVLGLLEVFFEAGERDIQLVLRREERWRETKKKEEMRERGSYDLKFKASCICHLTTHENILVF